MGLDNPYSKINRFLKKSHIDLNDEKSINKDNLLILIDLIVRKNQDDKNQIELLERSIRKTSLEIKEYIHEMETAQALALHNSKMAELGLMAANISHEINNPLAVILGSAELGEMNIANYEKKDILSKEDFISMKNTMDTIKKTATRISKIISGLKRVSNKSENIEFNEENLNHLIEETFAFGLQTLKKSRINLIFKANKEDIICKVPGIELSQVIINLITNAKQAMEKSDLALPKIINVYLEEKLENITITVTNSGPKISDEIKNKIFDSYFTTKKLGEGSGLGLHISRTLMKQMNGSLELNDLHDSPQFIIKFPKI